MNITPFNTFLESSKEKEVISEAFNSDPYELTFGKKGAGDVFFTFIDEDGKEFRIQFYTPAGLGKNVRQVFIGQKKGSVYPDAQQRFKNPMKVIATMIEATKQFLQTPIGKSIDGFAINFSRKALERGLTLLPKIIRMSDLKQKVNVMDLTYSPDPSRGYVWVIKKGKKPEAVFDGPKMKGVTWDNPDKVGDAPPEPSVGNTDWNISVMAKSNSIESTSVKVNGNDVILGSKDVAISVRDGAMATAAKGQTIAQVTIFDKQFVGRGSVGVARSAKDRQGMAWELKSNGKIVALVEFGVGAVLQSNDDKVTDAKWEALVAALEKTYFKGTVKTLGNSAMGTSIGQIVKDGIKIVVGMIRGSESVSINFDAYGPDNKQITLPLTARRFVDVDVNKPDTLTGVVNLATDVILEIANRDPNVVKAKEGSASKEMTQTQWRSLQKALFSMEGMTGVTSTTSATANFYIPEGRVRISMLRGVKSTDDPVTITITAVVDGVDMNAPAIIRDIDFTKPSQLPRLIKPVIDVKLDEIRKMSASKNKKTTTIDLSEYAVTVKGAAPKMRGVEWQVYTADNGQTLRVEYDITFRRNTRVGAMSEYRQQVNRCNDYLRDTFAAAKKAGFNPQQPILMTMDAAKDGDEVAERNEGSAYSEYEQAIGGSLTITK
ncbi:hypothetical protein G646_gp116 [Serratia phage phiMAM1]|uniref:Uncharacterized protein n=1 Tax=Serratia phage phiMAM1 TaxID=1262513 RepID=K7YGX7_9CAUD|nr:hypothetical protein G646_gp116 [Serratia phage phiMAM1]AFX93584.1 hypothetical protein MAM_116 [Serratia phage phiMAM1]